MGNLLGNLAEQFKALLAGMSASRRVAVLIFVGLLLSSLVALVVWSGKPDYQVLYTGLSQKDAGVIVSKLREQNIPFEQVGAGAIRVPSSRVHELRLTFAEGGLPTGGTLGFEIFDRSSLGITDFVQRVNFLRALQGELVRTISQIQAVESARVHIVIPERSLFADEKRRATASVALSLRAAGGLSKSQVKGIAHLVASAVDGLESKNVTIVDSRGNILAGGRGEDELGSLSTTQLEVKAGIERRLERRIESMLARIVGPGKVVARVDVELDMRRVERTREIFDPEKQVARSERRVKEKSESGRSAAGGVPGVQANVTASEQNAPSSGTGPGSRQKSSRTTETINFEIDKTVERIIEPVGRVKRISAAVIVDGTYTAAAGGGASQFQTRTPKEITDFTNLVTAAIGLNIKRGDTIQMISVPFKSEIPAAEPAGLESAFVLPIAKVFLGVAALVLIFAFVIRPLLSWVSTLQIEAAPELAEGAVPMLGPGGVPLPEGMSHAEMLEAAAAPAPPTPEEIEAEQTRKLYEQVYEFVANDPGAASEVIRGWTRERV